MNFRYLHLLRAQSERRPCFNLGVQIQVFERLLFLAFAALAALFLRVFKRLYLLFIFFDQFCRILLFFLQRLDFIHIWLYFLLDFEIDIFQNLFHINGPLVTNLVQFS